MNRVTRSWSIFKSSWSVLKADRELVMFPLVSSVCCVLLLASFAVPAVLLAMAGPDGAGGPGGSYSPTGAEEFAWTLLAFAFYVGAYFVMTFFNTALVACAVLRLRGGDPTFSYGIAEARKRVVLILQWSLLSATVGMILRAVEERAGLLGNIAARLFGMAWALASFFVVPVMVVDGVGPVAALKESGSLFRKTWGERVVGAVGFGLAGMVLAIPAVALLVLGVLVLVDGGGPWLAASLGAAAVAWLMAEALVMGTLQSIYQVALFLYVRDGAVPAGFDEEALASAYRAKS